MTDFLTKLEGEQVSSALYKSFFPQQQENIMAKVAVYGSLLSGFGNHDYFLTGSTKLSDTRTESDNFMMLSLGGFPGVIPCTSEEDKGKVIVEIYEVDADTLRKLDGLEGHPTFYERNLLEFEDGQSAWMYIYQGRSGSPINKTDSGDYSWREFYEHVQSWG